MSHAEQQSKIFTLLKWYHDRGIVYLPPQETQEVYTKVINDGVWLVYENDGAFPDSAILEMLNNIVKALKVESKAQIYALDQLPDLNADCKALPESLVLFGFKSLNKLSCKVPDATPVERICSFFMLKPWDIPTLLLESPAAMLRNPQLKAPAWRALQGFMKFLESRT